MGNDGGSIPKRRELVKEAAKAPTAAQVKEAQTEQQEYAWTTDPLTRKPLAAPIVSDAAGILYNKDAVLEYLLKDEQDAGKTEMRNMCSGGGAGGLNTELGAFGDRVKGLRDVVEVHFEVTDETGATKVAGGKWVCPITGMALGSAAKAVYLVPCGHAFAGRVVREVESRVCLTCNEPFTQDNIIPILPFLPADTARLAQRLKSLRENNLTHALKKAPGSKKRKKADKKGISKSSDAIHSSNTNTTTITKPLLTNAHLPATTASTEPLPNTATTTTNQNNNSTTIQNATTASLTRKVLQEQDSLHKKRKLAQNDNINSLFNKKQSTPQMANSADYMTRGFSIGRK